MHVHLSLAQNGPAGPGTGDGTVIHPAVPWPRCPAPPLLGTVPSLACVKTLHPSSGAGRGGGQGTSRTPHASGDMAGCLSGCPAVGTVTLTPVRLDPVHTCVQQSLPRAAPENHVAVTSHGPPAVASSPPAAPHPATLTLGTGTTLMSQRADSFLLPLDFPKEVTPGWGGGVSVNYFLNWVAMNRTGSGGHSA